MVAPERDWRMKRTSPRRRDEAAKACRVDTTSSSPSWLGLPQGLVQFGRATQADQRLLNPSCDWLNRLICPFAR